MSLFLVATCAARTATVAPDARWLVGLWCPDDPTTLYAGTKVGLRPTRFNADGSYSTFEDEGRWRLEGGLLHILTGNRMRLVDSVEPLGRKRMARNHAHGEREIWRRCSRW
jgi:hypothetical protein